MRQITEHYIHVPRIAFLIGLSVEMLMRANGRREELVNFQDKEKGVFLITITSFFYYLSVKRRKKYHLDFKLTLLNGATQTVGCRRTILYVERNGRVSYFNYTPAQHHHLLFFIIRVSPRRYPMSLLLRQHIFFIFLVLRVDSSSLRKNSYFYVFTGH